MATLKKSLFAIAFVLGIGGAIVTNADTSVETQEAFLWNETTQDYTTPSDPTEVQNLCQEPGVECGVIITDGTPTYYEQQP